MRWALLTIGIVLVATGLFLRWQEPPRQSLDGLRAEASLLRRVGSGPIVGATTRVGAQVWLGIPYAAAPEGEWRWRAARPPQPWTQPRQAVTFGAPCPQFASQLAGEPGEPGTLVGSEDCLSLNVFTPRGTDRRSALPVMFFLHGGGNTIGSARSYDGSRLAQEQGIVLVTINYRLGPLGWFSHEALRAAADNVLDASGNFALLDMVAALRWVRDNIAEFGGDPQRVTVFGESAGARNIYGLIASPQASGLFHGAIIQSGTAGTYTRVQAENAFDAAEPGHDNSSHELVLKWLQRSDGAANRGAAERMLGYLTDAELERLLRELPLGELMAPLASDRGMYSAPALIRDGAVLPAEPLLEVFARSRGWNQVPVLAGTNRDEIKLFLALDDQHTTRRFGLFPAVEDPARYETIARLHSDNWKAVGVDEPLARMATSAPDLPLFAYRFDWDAMRSNWLIDLPQLLGAAHGLELDFLFEPLFSARVPGVLTDSNRRDFMALGRAMRDYWAGFAYSGRPGSGRSAAYPPWPRWSPQEPLLMVLDAPLDAALRVEEVGVSVADVKASLAATTTLGARMRCALYVDMFRANNGVVELFSAREYQELGCAPFPARSLVGESR